MLTKRYTRVYGYAAVSTEEQAKDKRQSIPTQIETIKEVCKHNGWPLLDILVVDGFSRNYHQFHHCRDDMLAKGCDAFVRLEQLWVKREIDLFVPFNSDRFGRTSALLNAIAGELTDAGADIYLAARHLLIDKENFPTMGGILGIESANEIARLRQRWETGINGRLFHRNLYSTKKPITHKLLKTDDDYMMVVDESKRRFFDDLAELTIARLGYIVIAEELNKRGHRKESGNLYGRSDVRNILLSPITWGHLARGFTKPRVRGYWFVEEGEPIPDDIKEQIGEINYNAIEPVWKDEPEKNIWTASEIKASLRASRDDSRRGVPADSRHRFTGLFICAYCHHMMWHNNPQPHHYVARYRCFNAPDHHRTCGKHAIREDVATEEIKAILERFLRSGDISLLNSERPPKPDNTFLIERLKRDMGREDKRLEKLILERLDVDSFAQQKYIKLINNQNEKLADMHAELGRLMKTMPSEQRHKEQQRARMSLEQMTVETLFTKPDVEINKFLFDLLGDLRIYIKNGEIYDIDTKVKIKRR